MGHFLFHPVRSSENGASRARRNLIVSGYKSQGRPKGHSFVAGASSSSSSSSTPPSWTNDSSSFLLYCQSIPSDCERHSLTHVVLTRPPAHTSAEFVSSSLAEAATESVVYRHLQFTAVLLKCVYGRRRVSVPSGRDRRDDRTDGQGADRYPLLS